jgi:preprotein translocase subunit SecF
MTEDFLRLAAVLAAVCFALVLFAATGLEVSLDTPAGLLSLRIP